MAKKDEALKKVNNYDEQFKAAFADLGVDMGDVRETGNLLPAYNAEEAFENAWPPVFGRPIGFGILPVLDGDSDQARQPVVITFLLEKDTKGIVGTKTDKKEVDVKKGELINVYIGGSLQVNNELLMATQDPDKAALVCMAIEKLVQLKQITPMKKWKVLIAAEKHSLPRKGALALLPSSPPLPIVKLALVSDILPEGIIPIGNGEGWDTKLGQRVQMPTTQVLPAGNMFGGNAAGQAQQA